MDNRAGAAGTGPGVLGLDRRRGPWRGLRFWLRVGFVLFSAVRPGSALEMALGSTTRARPDAREDRREDRQEDIDQNLQVKPTGLSVSASQRCGPADSAQACGEHTKRS
eukprot:2922873-Rhodomonas_salina.2